MNQTNEDKTTQMWREVAALLHEAVESSVTLIQVRQERLPSRAEQSSIPPDN